MKTLAPMMPVTSKVANVSFPSPPVQDAMMVTFARKRMSVRRMVVAPVFPRFVMI